MKRYELLLTPFILICFLSCQKTDRLANGLNATDTAGGSFSATIEGKPWVAMDSARAASIMNGSITLSGLSVDRQQVEISLVGTTTGKYQLGPNLLNEGSWTDTLQYLQIFSTSEGVYPESGGQVEVTEIDQANQTLSGTFHFFAYSDSARRAVSITDGVFSKLPYITSLPPAPATDTFTVSINGEEWSAQSISGNLYDGEFIVEGSTTNGRKVLDLHMATPAGMGANAAGNDYQNFGPGWYFVDYRVNDSTYISAKILSVQNGNFTWILTPGDLVILENDLGGRRLRADFNAQLYDSTATNSVEIANGYFSIRY